MAEESVDIDVLFVGQTGIGKSSLINMIRCTDKTASPAVVSGDARPCTQQTTCYPAQLGNGYRCLLWDTRGLDEAADHRGFIAKFMDRIRQLASQQERELRETLRNRTRTAKPILMWCIHASKIDVSFHWQQFRKVYMEYCEGRAIPVVVITRMHPKTTGWEPRCRSQLQQLENLGTGSDSVLLLRVREHQSPSSVEYTEDSEALRAFISQHIKTPNA